MWFCVVGSVTRVMRTLDDLWFLDEAHFLLSGHVNSKNSIYWGSTRPEDCLQQALCTAWVAI